MHSNGHEPKQGGGSGGDMVGMMAVMMSMCVGVILLFAVIPSVGWPLAVAIAVAAFALMLFLHNRFMNHRRGG